MKEISIEKARAKLGDIVDRARLTGRATIITRHGEAAAIVAPVLRDGDLMVIAEASLLAAKLGHDSDAGGTIADLLDIIGRLTADTAEDL
jgi:prevent-host-death family protein